MRSVEVLVLVTLGYFHIDLTMKQKSLISSQNEEGKNWRAEDYTTFFFCMKIKHVYNSLKM